jgi:CHAT domain-containing protein
MAGAGNILMSLWEVDDNAAEVFMTLFYKHLLYERLDIHTVLQETRQAMRRSPHYRNPYYWAGFILLE